MLCTRAPNSELSFPPQAPRVDLACLKSRASHPCTIIRAVIAKRDRLAAEFVRTALCETGFEGEIVIYQSAGAALDALRRAPAELAFLGLTFADMDGLDVVGSVVRERLAFRLLVISTRRDEVVRASLRPPRINGFFHPGEDEPWRLPEAIRRIAAGGSYFSPNILTKPTDQTVDQMFTPHQLRIFAILCAIGNEEKAAGMLGLSRHTLHGHAQRIKRKLGARNLSQLILEGIRRGVVRVTPDQVLRPRFDIDPV